MPEEIRSKLHEIRFRLRVLLWARGISALIGVVCGSVLAGAFLDRAIVGESLSGRVFLTLGIGAAVAWIFRKELLIPLSRPLTDIWIARKIEAHYPDLHGSLASSVEFSSESYSEQNGSQDLQKKCVSVTVARILSLETSHLTSWRPLTIRAIPAAVLILVCLLFAVFRTDESLAALQRLAFPFRTVEWPRQVVLQLEDEHGTPLAEDELQNATYPRGSLREYHVRNLKGDLPEDLQLELKYSDDRTDASPIPREAELNGEGLVGRIRLEMQESFSFRVSGGDARTPWYEVKVVPPPVLKQLIITIQPPEYTHEPSFESPVGASFVQAVTGSVLSISGTADVSLAAANLVEQNSEPIPLELSGGGVEFEGNYQIDRLGPTYLKLSLTDEKGITNHSAVRLEIVGLADLAPTVKFLSPSTDQLLTPEAIIAVEVEAKDDFGLLGLELQFLKKNAAGEWEQISSKPLLSPALSDRQTKSAFEMTAGELGLTAGDTLSLRAIATDFLSSEEEHFGQDERQITLVTPGRKQEELAGRLHELLDRIERERINQKLVRESFDNLFDDPQQDAPSEIPGLTTDQKLIEQRLTSVPSGILEEIRKITREAQRNRLDHPVFERQLETLIADLEALDGMVFPSLNQFLMRIEPQLLGRNSKEQLLPNLADPVDPRELNRLLEQTPQSERGRQLHQLIESRQKQIEDVLGDLTGAIDEWQEGQTLKNSLGQILETQEQIDRDAKQLNTRTLGKTMSELSPAQRDDLRELSATQQGNAQRLDRFFHQLERELSGTKTPDHLNDLAEAITQSNVPALMGELEREFRENHLGQAVERNQQLLAELNNWDDLLHNRPVTGAEMKMQLLGKQLNALLELQDRQNNLKRDANAAGFRNEIPSERRAALEETQQKIERDAGRIERNFHRLQLNEPAQRMSDARREMNQSTAEFGTGQIPEDSLQDTENHLERAVQSVQQAQAQLQSEHERELAADLLPRLRELYREEGQLLAESTKLRIRQSQEQRWSRVLLRDLKLQEKTQETLRTRLEELAEPLKSVEAIELALHHVGNLMNHTISAFKERDLQAVTERHLPATLKHLEIMLSVLEQAAARQISGASTGQGGTQSSDDEQASDNADNLLLQLTILRAVQEQIHHRMADLADTERSGMSREEALEGWEQLQTDQQQVEQILLGAYGQLTAAQTVMESEQLEKLVKNSRDLIDRIDAHLSDIEQKSLTGVTRARQTEILKLWDSLLDDAGQSQSSQQAQSQPKPQEQNPPSDQNAQNNNPSNQQQPDPKSGSKDPKGNQPQDTTSLTEGKRQENDPNQPADKSTEQTRAREEAIRSANALRQEERKRLMREVWGQLPPRLRQKLMNASDEEYLPEYQDNIRDYFRNLSQQKSLSPPR